MLYYFKVSAYAQRLDLYGIFISVFLDEVSYKIYDTSSKNTLGIKFKRTQICY